MSESYSTSLKITLIGDGDLAGTWGDTTNTNWNLAEQAITGVDYLSSMGDTNYTLTNLNGTSDEARNQVIVIPSTTTLSATRYVYAPYVNKTYIISNQSSGGQAIYIQGIVSGTPTGSPLLIPNGITTIVYCDGANGFYAGATGSAGNFLVNGTLTAAGETETGNMTIGGNLAVTGTTTFTGIPSGPTASSGTNTTQLATTAFVQNVAGGLGTMSTQNANSVAITGGSITNLSAFTSNSSGSFGGTLSIVSPNSGSTGALQVRQNASGGNSYIQFTNHSGTAEYGDISVTPGGVFNLSPAAYGQAYLSGNLLLTTANIQSVTKLGLGITGENWHNLAGSRFANTTYTNSNGYPIMVIVEFAAPNSEGSIYIYVNGSLIVIQGDTSNSYSLSFIVPTGQTYEAAVSGSASIGQWSELY